MNRAELKAEVQWCRDVIMKRSTERRDLKEQLERESEGRRVASRERKQFLDIAHGMARLVEILDDQKLFTKMQSDEIDHLEKRLGDDEPPC